MKMYRNSLNMFDVSKIDPDNGYVEEKYLNTSGAEYSPSTAATACITEYIAVSANTTYTQDDFYTGSSGTPAIGFYDSTKTFISAVSVRNTPTFTTPTSCAYIRISRTTTSTTSMLNLGDTAIPFEPYNVVDWYKYKYNLRVNGAWTPTSDKEYSGGGWGVNILATNKQSILGV